MDKGITKDQSKMLQGIAILMMLYHHLFSTPEALGIDYSSLLNINGINIELHMAWFFKICVGIYAFVSGYGLCRSLRTLTNKKKLNNVSLPNNYMFKMRMILGKLLSFYYDYWLVFFVFVPIGFIFFNKQFDIKEFLLNLIGFSSSYNGAWWYVLQYLKMLIVLPFIDLLFTRFESKRYRIQWLFYVVLCVLFILLFRFLYPIEFGRFIEFFQPAFFLCFIIGYLISRFDIIEFLYKYLPNMLLSILGIIGLILVIVVRVKIAKDASSAGLDFIFVPVFLFGVIILMNYFTKISKVLLFFGKYSTYIWLVHVFFYDHYAKKLVMISKQSTIIYLTLLLLSTISAILLAGLKKYIQIGLSHLQKKA